MNWQKFKLGFWSVFWGAIGGAIVIAVIGFKWGGWVTGGTAQIMVGEAVVDRLALIYVAQFNQDSQKDQKLEELKKTDSWERDTYVKKQGWSTMLGEMNPIERLPTSVPSGLWRLARKVRKASKELRPPTQSGPHFSETMGESEGTQRPLCFATCPCIVLESICWDPTTNVL